MSDPSRHLVTFEVEDGGVYVTGVRCIAGPAADCRTGCPHPLCDDWSHGEAGCDHCQESCDCPCSTHEDADDCQIGAGCSCETFQEHGQGEECPHTFASLAKCWLLPWAIDDDFWFTEDPGVRALLSERVIKGRSEHPRETWTVVMGNYDYEWHDAYWPCDPDPDSLQRAAGAPA